MSNTPQSTSNPYSSLSTSYPTTSSTLQPGGYRASRTSRGSGGSNTSHPSNTFNPSTTSQPSNTFNPSTPTFNYFNITPLCGLRCDYGFVGGRDSSGSCACVPDPSRTPLCGLRCDYGFVEGRDSSGSCVCVPIPSSTSNPSSTSTPSSTFNPTNTPTTTSTPSATRTPNPKNIIRDVGAIDVNGYIKLAIHSMINNQHASAMNFINLAVNVQTQAGNGVGVAMLNAANQYIQAIMNPLLNNFDVPSENLSSIAIYFLVGTILCLCYMNTGYSLKGIHYPNIQNALLSLNTSPPNIKNATNYLNVEINSDIVAGNTQMVKMLQQVLGVVENYKTSSIQNLPLTPLQLCLTDFPLALMFLDGYPMKFSSINNYSVLWGSGKGQEQIQTQHANTNQDMFLGKNAHQRHGQNTGTNLSQFQTQGNVESNVPDAIQQYLVSRSILNGAMNDLVNYLTTKNNYQPLISNIQQIQNNMNTI